MTLLFRLLRAGWVRPSNDLRISCRRSAYCPHKSTLPLFGHQERGARTELRPPSACRLHARVRPHSDTHAIRHPF